MVRGLRIGLCLAQSVATCFEASRLYKGDFVFVEKVGGVKGLVFGAVKLVL